MVLLIFKRFQNVEFEIQKFNLVTFKDNKWTPVVAMQTKRSGVGLAVVGGQLLAVGGFDGVNYLKTVEILDSENGSWRLCSGSGNMHNRRLGGGVGVVKLNTPFSSYAHKGNKSKALNSPDTYCKQQI